MQILLVYTNASLGLRGNNLMSYFFGFCT